ncbi:hypothetical protein Tco_0984275, partial [Tanacetum coccineum]
SPPPQKTQKPKKPKRKDTQVPQSSVPTDNVADEAVHKELGDRLVRAATTASILEAEHDSARVESSRDKESLGEDASNQGRINAIDADDDITLVSVQNVDEEMFDVDALDGEEVFIAGQNENVVEKMAQVSTAAITVTITTKEITLTQALEALKTSKPKVKGIVFQDPCEYTTTKSTLTISSQQSQDKGKGIMIEEPVKPMKKKDLIRLDEEVALKLQAKFDEEERLARENEEEEERLAREKAQQIKEVNIAWDGVQAKVEADYQLAQRLQDSRSKKN